MIKNFEETKSQLKELAGVINSFKSEAVQLRLLELVFGAGEVPTEKEKPKNPAPTRKRKPRTKSKGTTSDETSKTGNRSSTRLGGAGALNRLIDEGFFKNGRTLAEIIQHCEENMARKFKQTDLSGILSRYTRDQKLTRAKNENGQYEYTQGK